jgi:hypothetical protein
MSTLVLSMSPTVNATQIPAEGTPLVGREANTRKSSRSISDRSLTVAAVMLLIIVGVCKVQLTAYLFSLAKYPTAYSFYTCIVSTVLLVPVFILVPSTWGVPTKEMFLGPHYALTLIVLFTTFDLGFTNIALANISAALQQCIAATAPFWTIMIESLLHRRCHHPILYGTVFGLVFGAVLASVAAVRSLSVFGAIAAVIAVVCSASKFALTHAAFTQQNSTKETSIGPLALLFWVDLLMIPIYVPWVLINGELIDMLNDSSMNANEWWQFTGTAALGGVRALTQYLMLSLVTATSTATANIFTMVLNIMISMTWQPKELLAVSPELFVGIVIVICCSVLYVYLKSSPDACCGVIYEWNGGDRG